MKITIIGGGIGGLTLGVALQRQGLPATIFEQAPGLRPVGAGIVLAGNAMQVYAELGLADRLRAYAQPIDRAQLTDVQLRPLSTTDLRPWRQRFGQGSVAIHRADLVRVLAEALPADRLKLGARLQAIAAEPDLELHFSNGTRQQTDCLIGADGIHSTVREQCFAPRTRRDSGQLCWRGVATASLPDALQRQITEVWGPNSRFGLVPLADGRVYWFAVLGESPTPGSDEEKNWRKAFSSYPEPVRDVLSRTPEDRVHRASLADLAISRDWIQDRVALLGDAAHAATPNLGQGAGQAIEDARVLAHCLAQLPVAKALRQYRDLRYRKANGVVTGSWRIGQMAHLRSPVLRGLRNGLLRVLPSWVGHRQLEGLLRLDTIP